MAYFEREFVTTKDRVQDAFVDALRTPVGPVSGDVRFLARGIAVPRAMETIHGNRNAGIPTDLTDEEEAELKTYIETCRGLKVLPFRAVDKMCYGRQYYSTGIFKDFFPEPLRGVSPEIREAAELADIDEGRPHVYFAQFSSGGRATQGQGFANFRGKLVPKLIAAHYETDGGGWEYGHSRSGESSRHAAKFSFVLSPRAVFKFEIPDKAPLSDGDITYLVDWFGQLRADYKVPEAVSATSLHN